MGRQLREFHQAQITSVFVNKNSFTLRSPIYGVPRKGDNDAPGKSGSMYKPHSYRGNEKYQIYFELNDDAPKGQAPAAYLFPQTVGGQVYRTRFQHALKYAGIIQGTQYALPIHNGQATRRGANGRMSTGQYVQTLWGIKAAEPDSFAAGKYANAKRPPKQSNYFVVTQAKAEARRNPNQGLRPGIYMRSGRARPSMLYAILPKVPNVTRKYEYAPLTQQKAPEFWSEALSSKLAEIDPMR